MSTFVVMCPFQSYKSGLLIKYFFLNVMETYAGELMHPHGFKATDYRKLADIYLVDEYSCGS